MALIKREMSEEENINQSTDNSPQLTENEIISELKTPAHQLQTEEMETHAQHLHKAPGNGWKHYFFEFFMLFLAVTLGFLVENLREHYVEKARGNEYIRSMYEDLKNDTARINNLIKYNDEKIVALNQMYSCYDTVIKDMKSTDCMGILIKYSKSNKVYTQTDRTLRQLANAGGYRLLNKEDADSIIAYENIYSGCQNFQSTFFQDAQDNVRNTLNLLADFKVITSQRVTASATGADTSIKLNGPLLFTEDRIVLNKWFNELAMYLRAINGQRNIILGLRNKATSLLEYFKNKYHLENE